MTSSARKTIARNRTMAIETIRACAKSCTVYTLENQFRGEPVHPRFAFEALQSGLRSKLTDNGNGTYTVHVHSNHWYEISMGTPVAPTDCKIEAAPALTHRQAAEMRMLADWQIRERGFDPAEVCRLCVETDEALAAAGIARLNAEGAAWEAPAPVLTVRQSLEELLEICRYKCGPGDEVVLANGKTNHQALLDAVAALHAAE